MDDDAALERQLTVDRIAILQVELHVFGKKLVGIELDTRLAQVAIRPDNRRSSPDNDKGV